MRKENNDKPKIPQQRKLPPKAKPPTNSDPLQRCWDQIKDPPVGARINGGADRMTQEMWDARHPEEAAQRRASEAEAELKPRIQLPGNNRLLSEFATELGEVLKDKELYQRGGIPVMVNRRKDGLELIHPQLFQSLVEYHVTGYAVLMRDGEAEEVDRTMSDKTAQSTLRANQFIAQLPPIDKFATACIPVMRKDGKIELLGAGYDKESATLVIPACEFDDRMSLAQAKQTINELLAEFSFADDGGRSIAVAVAAMVGQFANGLLPQGTPRPIFSYLANAEGAGKTLCAKCAILPTHGAVEISGDFGENHEMRKVLLTAVMEGRDYICFDNCKGYLNSPVLESFASSTQWKDRVLGVSKTFSGENNVSLFITGNGCTFSPDLRRRSLVVQLFMAEEFAEERKFKRTLDDVALQKIRPTILAALWAFVREWDKAGRPKASMEHGSFPRWAEIIGGIVEFAGYSCPLERAKIEGMVDADGNDMAQLVEAMHEDRTRIEKALAENRSDKPRVRIHLHGVSYELSAVRGGYDFEYIVETCRHLGLFDRLVNDVGLENQLKPSARSAFGYVLRRYDGRCFGRERPLYFAINGKGHGRRFRVSADRPC